MLNESTTRMSLFKRQKKGGWYRRGMRPMLLLRLFNVSFSYTACPWTGNNSFTSTSSINAATLPLRPVVQTIPPIPLLPPVLPVLPIPPHPRPNPPLPHRNHPIRIPPQPPPMPHAQHRPPPKLLRQHPNRHILRLPIQHTRRLVQQQHPPRRPARPPPQHRPHQRQQLRLAARHVLRVRCIRVVQQRLEPREAEARQDGEDSCVGVVFFWVEVRAQGAERVDGILADADEALAEQARRDGVDGHAVDFDCSVGWIVQAEEEGEEGGFAAIVAKGAR